MPILNVVFFGLISHVGSLQQKKHAVLIDDFPTHKPRLFVRFQRPVDLDRGDITFHAEGGRTIRRPARCDNKPFLDFVPHLGYLTDGVLKPNVDDATNRQDAYGYVKYPGGELLVRSLYRCRSHYLPPPVERTQCVPQTILLNVHMDAEKVFIRYPQIGAGIQEKEIDTNECVLIVNAEELRRENRDARREREQHCNGTRGSHNFQKHKVIMDGHVICSVVQKSRCKDPFTPPRSSCNWVDDVIILYTDAFEVECANTQYP